MDQVKIGKFISDLRKEQGMTQQQLSDAIGVSNKTISKWECGNGMPEISSVMPLCQTLQINVNELLSGERLPEKDYSRKAEENMMNLIQETEITKKKSSSALSMVVIVVAMIVGVWYCIVMNTGVSGSIMFLDSPSLVIMLFFTVLFLLGTRLGKPFLRAFKIVIGKRPDVTQEEVAQSEAAVSLVACTLLATGSLVSITGFISIGIYYIGMPFQPETVGGSMAVALIGIFYGVIGYMAFLPIKIKLQVMRK